MVFINSLIQLIGGFAAKLRSPTNRDFTPSVANTLSKFVLKFSHDPHSSTTLSLRTPGPTQKLTPTLTFLYTPPLGRLY